jgi:hypothetical protein
MNDFNSIPLRTFKTLIFENKKKAALGEEKKQKVRTLLKYKRRGTKMKNGGH